jgi:predicted ATP-grasp superfamily ATP-dependent carboligase
MRALVTYGWCRTAYVICESLSRAGFRVSACGDSALSMTRVSRYVDTFDRVPDCFGCPRLYATAVAEVVRKRGVGFVVPAHEDFVPLQEFRHLLPPEVIIAGPPSREGREVLDKWKLVQRATRAGIPVPETYAPDSIEEAERILVRIAVPAILKPHCGNGGKGVVLVHNPRQGIAEYRRLVNQFGLGGSTLPMIQQYIAGEQMGGCFISVNGILRACFVERYLRCKQAGFGTSVLREHADNDEIRECCARLCAEMNWTGVGHLDFIVGGPGAKPYLLEMNPRFWGALNLSVRNGFDFPAALASLATTGDVDPRSFAVRPAVRSLWIAGELMACLDDVRHGRWSEVLRSPGRFFQSKCYDDFRLRDPFPLIVELAYYLSGFIRANGDVNPVRVGMINRHSETV